MAKLGLLIFNPAVPLSNEKPPGIRSFVDTGIWMRFVL